MSSSNSLCTHTRGLEARTRRVARSRIIASRVLERKIGSMTPSSQRDSDAAITPVRFTTCTCGRFLQVLLWIADKWESRERTTERSSVVVFGRCRRRERVGAVLICGLCVRNLPQRHVLLLSQSWRSARSKQQAERAAGGREMRRRAQARLDDQDDDGADDETQQYTPSFPSQAHRSSECIERAHQDIQTKHMLKSKREHNTSTRPADTHIEKRAAGCSRNGAREEEVTTTDT